MRTPGTTQQHPSIEHEEGRAAPSSTGLAPQVNRRAPRWSARRHRDAWFLLIVLLLGIGTIMTLSYGGAPPADQKRGKTPQDLPAPAPTTRNTARTTAPPRAISCAHARTLT